MASSSSSIYTTIDQMSDFSYSSDENSFEYYHSLSSGDEDTRETFVDRSMASSSSSFYTTIDQMSDFSYSSDENITYKFEINLFMWDLDLIESSLSHRHEAKFIQQIVTKISVKLHVINRSIDEDLVGIESRVENVISFLEVESEDDVRMIGIWGMGGAGKTTLARAVFDHISNWFEGSSFVHNVRESSKGTGLKELQKQVLRDVLKHQSTDVTSVYDGVTKMKQVMPHRKVLVVLDDVDGIDQLEALARKPSWFKPGSRIIITTRDKQVLITQGVHVDNIYNICLLSREEAICLFSRRAFRTEFPIQGHEQELSREVVKYADGLPLTIKVLGSLLCGSTEPIWLDTLKRLKEIPLKETLKILEISYDSLEEDQKEIFLEVACILKGESKKNAIRILESCGFHAQIGLEVLDKKSLINISNGYLDMHDHIEEMGRNIVRRLHPKEPNRHSRLWVQEEIKEILVKDLGTKATRSMILKYTNIHPAIVMKSLRKMKELRLLVTDSCNDDDDEGVQYLPDTLRSLCWYYYPFSCLPKSFQANNLINLEMRYSNISQLREGGERKVLEKLRFLDLRYSKLITIHLGITPNLETLNLYYCEDLIELKMPSELPMLNCLDLTGFLPSSSGNLEKLLSFGLCACTNLESFSASICGLQHLSALTLEGCIPEVPKDLWKLESLEQLTLSMKEIKHLPDNICMLKHLKSLDLKSCEHLEQLPMDLGGLECLEELHLTDCVSLRDIPDSICKMKFLKNLHLTYCIQVEKLPEELGRIECLKLLNIEGAGISRLPESIFQLKDLRIIGSTWQLKSYGFTSVTEISTNIASCYIGDYFDSNL
ncbi:hypothetical protein E3N88_09550 [Mikania micrantha]|uniref:Uncharacterized protein n=1 Tax=Mikania micrantha TaxID=192012 RepID=A0A5N6PJF5_9ASTR|nr:hypothetical protein E3N88_09550 [Mikania micrantha]